MSSWLYSKNSIEFLGYFDIIHVLKNLNLIKFFDANFIKWYKTNLVLKYDIDIVWNVKDLLKKTLPELNLNYINSTQSIQHLLTKEVTNISKTLREEFELNSLAQL